MVFWVAFPVSLERFCYREYRHPHFPKLAHPFIAEKTNAVDIDQISLF